MAQIGDARAEVPFVSDALVEQIGTLIALVLILALIAFASA